MPKITAKMYKLHLELVCNLPDEEMAILRKYGRVEKAISRDIVIPEDMTLHALHYAIQRAFGWQNAHLHAFTLDPFGDSDAFKALAGDNFAAWGKLCGRYFRFPVAADDEEEMQDQYWDDVYDGVANPKIWLRKKYSGPYAYDGVGEHYLAAQLKYRDFVKKNPRLQPVPSFDDFLKGKHKSNKIVPVGEMRLEDADRTFEGGLGCLLERLRVDEVLRTGADSEAQVVDADGAMLDEYSALVGKYNLLAEKEERWEYLTQHSLMYLNKMDRALIEIFNPFEEFIEANQKLGKLYEETDGRVAPVTDVLHYTYDFGDSWSMTITCTDTFTLEGPPRPALGSTGQGPNPEDYVVRDRQGSTVTGKPGDAIAKAYVRYTTKCLAVDGASVMDDVGGVPGYCDFLRTIHDGASEDREEMLAWSEGMAWTGRKPAVDTLL